MNRLQKVAAMVLVTTLVFPLGALTVMAQDDASGTSTEQTTTRNRGERPQRAQRGQGRQFDRTQMMERMMERYKEGIDCTDEEWGVIEPLIKDVFEARMETRGARFGGFGGRRGGPQANEENQTQLQKDMDALEKAVESSKSSDDIKAKLQKVRDEKKKNEEKLAQAQKKLQSVLTVKQEAQMVLLGILD